MFFPGPKGGLSVFIETSYLLNHKDSVSVSTPGSQRVRLNLEAGHEVLSQNSEL